MNLFKHYIQGRGTVSHEGGVRELVDPATGKPWAKVAEGTGADVQAAVGAAHGAFASWAGWEPRERGRFLLRLADRVEQEQIALAELESRNTGKPLRESTQADLPLTWETLRYFGGWADKVGGEQAPVHPRWLALTLKEPVGVVGIIVPGNYPLMLAAFKLAPALAAGCTVVVKPAEATPASILRLAELATEEGLPPGVFNVVCGAVGPELVEHPLVKRVAFTGAPGTGRQVMARGAETLKQISLELGGKSPQLVFEDAHLESAIAGIHRGIFYNQGELCTAGSRLYVHRSVMDTLTRDLVSLAEGLKVGNPLDRSTEVGAITTQAQFDRVLKYLETAEQGGAKILTGGSVATGRGFFIQPTVVECPRGHVLMREEVFGPVLAVCGFDEEKEAVDWANDSPYGLAAGLWTRDVDRVVRVSRALEAGTVWVNCYNEWDPAIPFGGAGESGIGRELGREGMESFLKTKSIWIKRDGPA